MGTLAISEFGLHFQYRALFHKRHVRSPGTNVLPVTQGHRTAHLQQVPEVVCGPRGQQLPQGHGTERRMGSG